MIMGGQFSNSRPATYSNLSIGLVNFASSGRSDSYQSALRAVRRKLQILGVHVSRIKVLFPKDGESERPEEACGKARQLKFLKTWRQVFGCLRSQTATESERRYRLFNISVAWCP